MNRYIIDGNNLIPKVKKTAAINGTNPQGARELLALTLEKSQVFKKSKIHLFFDGHENGKIAAGGIHITYSGSKEADHFIRKEIEKAHNGKQLTVVSSDHGIINLAKVCGCRIIKSEEMAAMLENESITADTEAATIDKLKNENQEFFELFARKKKP